MKDLPGCSCDTIHKEAVEAAHAARADDAEYTSLAALLKLFGDPTRARILHALEASELCVCDLAVLLSMTKSAISHQLKLLRMANLVKYRKDGQFVYYSLADDHVVSILDTAFEHIRE